MYIFSFTLESRRYSAEFSFPESFYDIKFAFSSFERYTDKAKKEKKKHTIAWNLSLPIHEKLVD